MLQIPFEWLEFAFKCFESLSNRSHLNSKSLNFFRTIWIYFRMLKKPFEWFEFGFEYFEFLSNGLNLHLNASKTFRISIRMIRIPFEWVKFPFEFFESHSKSSNSHLNKANFFSNGYNLHSNSWSPFQWLARIFLWMLPCNFVRRVRICISRLRIWIERLEFAFECFES